MSFLQRVATFATMTFGIAVLTGASTPSFASQPEPQHNAMSDVSVPALTDLVANQLAMPSAPATVQPAVVQIETTQIEARQIETPQAENPQVENPAPIADDYETLSAAVAAQDAPESLGEDLTCLAGAIYFEAKGEPLNGQLAVADVILNRAKSGRFAKSVCGVVKQAGQFSFVRGGRLPAIANNAHYRTAISVAQVALGDHWDSSAPKALYFHARRVTPGWRMQKVASIGNHVFYR